jgi:ubiquitin carboxyl-terminal hydrolase 36/42
MQSICLDEVGGAKAVDISAQETTLIQYIFGGQLQSQVNYLTSGQQNCTTANNFRLMC